MAASYKPILGPVFGSSQGFLLKVDEGERQASVWGPLDCSLVSASSARSPAPCQALFPASSLDEVSSEQQWFLALSGHRAAAYEFSGHLLLNCVPIESNTITL